MNICKRCIETHHPDYFNHINPDTIAWSTAVCHLCGARSEFIITTTKELLDNPRPRPKSQQPKRQIVRKAKRQPPATLLEPELKESTPMNTKKEKYKYLLIDRDDADPYKFHADKGSLLQAIRTAVFTLNHEDIEVYKLIPLPHTAEIKIEIGE